MNREARDESYYYCKTKPNEEVDYMRYYNGRHILSRGLSYVALAGAYPPKRY